MEYEFLNIVLMPFDFFLEVLEKNPFNFTSGFVTLIFISASYRYILAPILGSALSSGSDTVKKNNDRKQK